MERGTKSSSDSCVRSVRFTRRTATVTISAPEASSASRIRGKVAYLPVPTIRRERNGRPPKTKGSVSAAAVVGVSRVGVLDMAPSYSFAGSCRKTLSMSRVFPIRTAAARDTPGATRSVRRMLPASTAST